MEPVIFGYAALAAGVAAWTAYERRLSRKPIFLENEVREALHPETHQDNPGFLTRLRDKKSSVFCAARHSRGDAA